MENVTINNKDNVFYQFSVLWENLSDYKKFKKFISYLDSVVYIRRKSKIV